jgi:hypothetical protein
MAVRRVKGLKPPRGTELQGARGVEKEGRVVQPPNLPATRSLQSENRQLQ